MENEQTRSYWSQEVAKLLDVSTSTLRKWSIAMEAEGYAFVRDENDKRAYLERDIMPLQKMRELLSEGMNMENAAKAVVLRFAEHMSGSGTMVVIGQEERSPERYLELMNEMQDMRRENREMKGYLDRIDQRLEQQNEGLTQLLREQLEVRRMLAAAAERERRRGWLSKLFRKG